MQHCKQNKLYPYIIAMSLLFIISCSTNQPTQKIVIESPAQHLSNTTYNLYFHFSEEGPQPKYFVKSEVLFELNTVSQDIAFNLINANINELIVNNKTIEVPHYNGKQLIIAQKNLNKGANTIIANFSANYSKDTAGLVRYQNEKDQLAYIYTEKNPSTLAYLTPYIPQENTASVFNIAAETPENWRIITMSSFTNASLPNKGHRLSLFAPTKQTPSQNLTLIAGPFTSTKSILNKLAHLWLQENQNTATEPAKTLFNDYINYTTDVAQEHSDALSLEQPTASADTIAPTPISTRTVLAKKSFFEHLQKIATVPCSKQTQATLDAFIKNNPTLPEVLKNNFLETKKEFET